MKLATMLSIALPAAFSAYAILACSSSETAPPNTGACPVGSAHCPCTSGRSCDQGLSCESDVCVGGSSGGSGGAIASSSGGTGGATAAAFRR